MLTVLVADDELNMRILLKATLEELEDMGVELLTAGNGEEALKIINTKKPQLVILDVKMPGMSGFEVCNTVKNVLGMKNTYILMLSAEAQEVDKQRGMEVGADIYMTKPFQPDELLERVADVLGIKMQRM
jgi:two-component system, OmpR family, alkaline phosphatase synthesis response regulator PhoP